MNGKLIVDTGLFLEDMCQLMCEDRCVVIPVSGGSMSPFLVGGRDYILLRKPCEKDLKRGKIVLYKRNTGQFVLHRIHSVKKGKFFIIGDGQWMIEGPVQKKQIVAVEDRIMRKNKWIAEFSPVSLFFRCVWIRIIFARRFVIKIMRILGNKM